MRISGLLLAVGLFSSVLALSESHACLWDRDTLAQEAKGRLHVVQTATGYFDRNPPQYYTMRLDRVSKEIEKTPGKLDLYDDAGVACDKLGRADEAIAWMEKKKAVMDSLPPSTPRLADSRYKYLANLGTFHAHRWVKSQDRAASLGDLKEAVRLIDEAIKLNPNAHFGREEYQLAALKWLLAGYESQGQPLSGDAGLQGEGQGRKPLTFVSQHLAQKEAAGGNVDHDHAVAGLCGIVQLGAAWESVDVFLALTEQTSIAGHGSLAVLAHERLRELYVSERQSLSQDQKYLNDLEKLVTFQMHLPSKGEPHDQKGIIDYYRKARAAADTRNRSRTEYMNVRFARGEHPDTHPGFWSQWKEQRLPEMPGSTSPISGLLRLFR